MPNIHLNSSSWEKAGVPKTSAATHSSLNFKTCYKLKIRSGKKLYKKPFVYLYFIFEIFYFKQSCNSFFHVKRGYWI